MVRVPLGGPHCPGRSPHVRGDGPGFHGATPGLWMFSPRAWGWSDSSNTELDCWRVLPTCVGMVRCWLASWYSLMCSPHVRGDGPRLCLKCQRSMSFSPRAWGWSAPRPALCICFSVLPTCVGMVRDSLFDKGLVGRSPHVRGDGPNVTPTCTMSILFSPRAWGWSGISLRITG